MFYNILSIFLNYLIGGSMKKFNAALLQTLVYSNKGKNIENAVKFIKQVSDEGADMAILPEMFCCPYDNSCFREYGEEEGGEAYTALKKAARENSIYVVGGCYMRQQPWT
jgi:predicted amidohydrolase